MSKRTKEGTPKPALSSGTAPSAHSVYSTWIGELLTQMVMPSFSETHKEIVADLHRRVIGVEPPDEANAGHIVAACIFPAMAYYSF